MIFFLNTPTSKMWYLKHLKHNDDQNIFYDNIFIIGDHTPCTKESRHSWKLCRSGGYHLWGTNIGFFPLIPHLTKNRYFLMHFPLQI